MNWRSSVHYPLYYLVAAFALLRLVVIPHFGLGVDEAHYVLYAQHLSLSYFDHPPLVGWVQYLFTALFGNGPFGARVAAVVIGLVASVMLYALLFRVSQNPLASLVAVAALNASFLFNALFMMLMPDTLLFVLIVPIILATLRVEQENTVKQWAWLGLWLGIAGLAKYTAVLFILPIALYLVLKKRFDLFITPKMLPGMLIGLVCIAPVLVWNFQHDWISFTYQSDHVVGSDSVNWLGFAQSIAAQFGTYSPLLFPIAFFGLYKAFQSRLDLMLISALFGVVLMAFFTYASLFKPALPHWTALFYLLFIPIGSYYLWERSARWRNYLKTAIALSGVITLVLYAELVFKFVPFDDYQSIHRDIYGFDTIMQEANALIEDPEQQAIAVTNWTLASRAIYYNQPYNSTCYLIDKRYDQFDFWQQDDAKGKDLLFITTHFFKSPLEKRMKCDSLTPLKHLDISRNGRIINTIEMTRCDNFQGLNP